MKNKERVPIDSLHPLDWAEWGIRRISISMEKAVQRLNKRRGRTGGSRKANSKAERVRRHKEKQRARRQEQQVIKMKEITREEELIMEQRSNRRMTKRLGELKIIKQQIIRDIALEH